MIRCLEGSSRPIGQARMLTSRLCSLLERIGTVNHREKLALVDSNNASAMMRPDRRWGSLQVVARTGLRDRKQLSILFNQIAEKDNTGLFTARERGR